MPEEGILAMNPLVRMPLIVMLSKWMWLISWVILVMIFCMRRLMAISKTLLFLIYFFSWNKESYSHNKTIGDEPNLCKPHMPQVKSCQNNINLILLICRVIIHINEARSTFYHILVMIRSIQLLLSLLNAMMKIIIIKTYSYDVKDCCCHWSGHNRTQVFCVHMNISLTKSNLSSSSFVCVVKLSEP